MGVGSSKTQAQSKTAAPAAASKVAAAATAGAGGGISLAPSGFAAGGGLLDDADVTITDAMFVLWDYDGKSEGGAQPALGIEYTDSEGKTHDQYYSAGSRDFFVPNSDGSGLSPVADKTSISNQCNAAIFLLSLVGVGLDENVLASGNIKVLTGLKLHVNQIPAPERSGIPNKDGKKRTILVATKLLAMPGEAVAPVQAAKAAVAPAKVNGKAAAAAVAAPVAVAPAVDEELRGEAVAALLEVLGNENGGPVPRKSIGPKVFGVRKGHARQAEIMKLAFDENFLQTAGEGMWTYDGNAVTMAG